MSIPNQQAQLDAINTIKESLLNEAFRKYNELVAFIKKLPIDQNIKGIDIGLSHIDTGILWVKEILLTAQLLLGEPAKPESIESSATPDTISPAQ